MNPNEITLGPFTGLPANPNKTRGQHWSKIYKEGEEWKRLVGYAGLAHKSKNRSLPFEKATVYIHVIFGDNRNRDWDNLVASFKPVIDGLKGIVIRDDGLKYIGVPQFSHEWAAKPSEHQFIIRIHSA
jgi:hypothetical protein